MIGVIMSQIQQNMEEGIKFYRRRRTDAELDLTTLVRELLVKAEASIESLDAFDSDKFVLESKDKSTEVQRYLLNQFWNKQLLMSETPSIDERSHLLANGTIQDWISLFETNVLPFILSNNLPRKL